MAPKLILHRATLSADEEYYFLAPPNSYNGDIGTATGISKATETEQNKAPTSVAALVTNGKLFRIKASYMAGAKQRTIKLLCQKIKLSTILDDLNGKIYTGGSINGKIFAVRFSQKASFY